MGDFCRVRAAPPATIRIAVEGATMGTAFNLPAADPAAESRDVDHLSIAARCIPDEIAMASA
jgi:hypothetical protein